MSRIEWYAGSGETVSRYFNAVLRTVLQLHTVLLRKPEPITNTCTDGRWKWFQNCLGALDDTYIKVNVSVVDRPRYRTRKGEIATNVLAVCDQNGEGYYYLCDAGYPNAEGFLAPYRGERYHLSDWRGAGNTSNCKRIFKHETFFSKERYRASVWLLKGQWAILRRKSFYPIQVQCRTITACCLIHNLITREMGIGTMLNVPDEENSASVGLDGDHIEFVESLEEWIKFRDDLTVKMFTQWQRA
ncbi:uncharacterized protein LOC120075895 [Benincasa hispida]|uniref:uncharacterized protein LOC120075895 n=1 Tax=Benincasa hispida TaxID=102211 RepID=UPI001900C097|nr:uncharacterized protein LOC120075895 [Benincasa hispida]